jgi:hypothetical protein
MKMRAAVSHHYGQDRQLGNQPWTEVGDSVWSGNPSLSIVVSQYMVSLRRLKVRRILLSPVSQFQR